jgi:putative FmdB family regulatory protein
VPRYDYECNSCGNVFELKQSFDSSPVASCPDCASAARRLIYSVPVVFKGSGFYVNDYGKGKSGSNGTSDSTASTGSDSKSESKSDDKPKAKDKEKASTKAAKDD